MDQHRSVADDGVRGETGSRLFLRLLSHHRVCIRFSPLDRGGVVGARRNVPRGRLGRIAVDRDDHGRSDRRFCLDRESHLASQHRAGLRRSAIRVGHRGVCTRTFAGNQLPVEPARVFCFGESWVSANHRTDWNLRTFIHNGCV